MVHSNQDLPVTGKFSLWLFVCEISCHQDRISKRTKDLPSHTKPRALCLRKRSGDPAGFGCNLPEGRSGSPAAPPGLVPFKPPYTETRMAGPDSETRRRLNDRGVLPKHIRLKSFTANLWFKNVLKAALTRTFLIYFREHTGMQTILHKLLFCTTTT